ncbi:sodium/calcium exchanger NCL-like [Chenopodium quinoa]|uniref:EF-hand domain-containing protein n=1 Tax=Chenopodium quinoa TaxID=63459 RepID=A0A803MZM9_CHEQI|nr:sodium/calcium exchanger NCL-like [Chenopodium quinoa]
MKLGYTPIFSFLILFIATVYATSEGGDPISGRIGDVGSSYIRFPSLKSVFTAETCEQSYGFLPCTTTALGNCFLILVYGFLMYTAATYLSNGSELLLEILGPGIIGGLFLPILGALPDAMLILVSGLSGTPAIAQDQVSVGMGLLAGSTVMLLTVIWGSCVLIGKCDLENNRAIDEQDTKGFSLLGSGVSTDIWTSYAARIMAISVLPFLVVQLPQALNSSSGRHLAVLIGLILSLVMLLSYCAFQVFQPWMQERRLDYVKHKRVLTGFLKHLKKHSLGKLCNPDGTLNDDVVKKVFKAIDRDDNGFLSKGELGAFVVGMNFKGVSVGVGEDDIVEKVMKEFDVERPDDRIDLEEFTKGISKLLNIVRGDRISHNNADTMKYLNDYDEEAEREHFLLGDSGEEGGEVVENPKATTIKAVIFLVLGTIIAGVFADPLVDAVDNFSEATSIPSFFISFIALPLATNSSEAVSAIIFATRKKKRSASLTFSELYGAATMNNVLCLSVFLALVYVRGLTWNFSSEVLVIFLVCIIMGGLGSFRTTFPLWTCFVAFLLYPLSLVLVYVLDYVFGWS